MLTKKDMSELKAYSKPPALVELCLKGVMTVLKKSPTWDAAKKMLGDTQFLPGLLNFDKDKLDDALLGKMKKYVNDPEYAPEKIGAVSGAAKGLCQWVHAMFIYGNIAKEVAPKRAKLKAAQEALEEEAGGAEGGGAETAVGAGQGAGAEGQVRTRPHRKRRRWRMSSRTSRRSSSGPRSSSTVSRREDAMGAVHRDVRRADRGAPG